ncbi:hypothetical protein FB45DRAFT_874422 [Roridomyces roridus]|uniref:Uncharacterized protein n=1 Tax=Roridomyces roridus TaxID=1738132 RepID=A0AAD7B8S2_9AGAR|nr:hypothetical protein FB45DRAFT_874422 [Roridomyces roridus]
MTHPSVGRCTRQVASVETGGEEKGRNQTDINDTRDSLARAAGQEHDNSLGLPGARQQDFATWCTDCCTMRKNPTPWDMAAASALEFESGLNGKGERNHLHFAGSRRREDMSNLEMTSPRACWLCPGEKPFSRLMGYPFEKPVHSGSGLQSATLDSFAVVLGQPLHKTLVDFGVLGEPCEQNPASGGGSDSGVEMKGMNESRPSRDRREHESLCTPPHFGNGCNLTAACGEAAFCGSGSTTGKPCAMSGFGTVRTPGTADGGKWVGNDEMRWSGTGIPALSRRVQSGGKYGSRQDGQDLGTVLWHESDASKDSDTCRMDCYPNPLTAATFPTRPVGTVLKRQEPDLYAVGMCGRIDTQPAAGLEHAPWRGRLVSVCFGWVGRIGTQHGYESDWTQRMDYWEGKERGADGGIPTLGSAGCGLRLRQMGMARMRGQRTRRECSDRHNYVGQNPVAVGPSPAWWWIGQELENGLQDFKRREERPVEIFLNLNSRMAGGGTTTEFLVNSRPGKETMMMDETAAMNLQNDDNRFLRQQQCIPEATTGISSWNPTSDDFTLTNEAMQHMTIGMVNWARNPPATYRVERGGRGSNPTKGALLLCVEADGNQKWRFVLYSNALKGSGVWQWERREYEKPSCQPDVPLTPTWGIWLPPWMRGRNRNNYRPRLTPEDD